jgi:hypothetical protein
MNRRELERKYVVTYPKTLGTIQSQLQRAMPHLNRLEGFDTDTYYVASCADFVRLRTGKSSVQGHTEIELTTKYTDQGSNENREELNVKLIEGTQILPLLERALGPAIGSVEKQFTKFKLHGNVEIALYKVTDDKRVFLEIEAPSVKLIEIYEALISETLTLVREERSIFQMFIKGTAK